MGFQRNHAAGTWSVQTLMRQALPGSWLPVRYPESPYSTLLSADVPFKSFTGINAFLLLVIALKEQSSLFKGGPGIS